jgi:hypothetical protein
VADQPRKAAGPGLIALGALLLFDAFLVFLWCVFGAAGAGNSNVSAQRFLTVTIIASSLPWLVSVVLAIIGRRTPAMLAAILVFPAAFAALWLV